MFSPLPYHLFAPLFSHSAFGRRPRALGLVRVPGTMINNIMTPHLGGTTEEALERTAEAAAKNVISVLNGTKPDTALGTKEYLS